MKMTHWIARAALKGAIPVVSLGAILSACGESDQDETCPGEYTRTVGEHTYCLVSQNIIEKGFDCPSSMAHQHQIAGGVACSHSAGPIPETEREVLESFLNVSDPKDPIQGGHGTGGVGMLCGSDPSVQACASDAD